MFTRAPRAAAVAACAGLVAAVVLAACGGTGSSTAAGHGATSHRSTAAALPASPADGGEKAPLKGLIDMGIQTPYHLDLAFPTVDTSAITPYAGSFGGIVVNETWAQLEPTQDSENWAPLNASLAAVSQWNTAHPSTPVGVKLRIFAGSTAPTWAKTLGGPSLTITTKGLSNTYGEWWTTPYRQAWSSFQHALASHYDSNPLVRAVSVGSCATLTGEPFVMNLTKPAIQVMQAAGWTPQAQEWCLQGAISDYSGWVRTPIDFAFNTYRTVAAGRAVPDPSFTDQVMQSCAGSRARGGPTCVLGNNALSSAAATGRSAPVYSQINTLWQEAPGHVGVYFQTVGAGVDCGAIAVAVSHHASGVELWPPNHRLPGFGAIPPATLAQWDTALRTGSTLHWTT